MNNGQLHDRLMLDPIESCLRDLGAEVDREKHLGAYGHSGIVDLFTVLEGKVFLIEAETRCTRRVLNDVRKAQAVLESGVTCRLVIAVPTQGVAQAVRRLLQRALQRGDLDGVDWKKTSPTVLTAGYVCHWLYKTFQPSVPPCSSRPGPPEFWNENEPKRNP